MDCLHRQPRNHRRPTAATAVDLVIHWFTRMRCRHFIDLSPAGIFSTGESRAFSGKLTA
jgi:hypothetical protein